MRTPPRPPHRPDFALRIGYALLGFAVCLSLFDTATAIWLFVAFVVFGLIL